MSAIKPDPRLEPISHVFDEIDELIAQSREMGVTYKQIAMLAGISTSTLRRTRNRQDVLTGSMQKLLRVYGRELAIVSNEDEEG